MQSGKVKVTRTQTVSVYLNTNLVGIKYTNTIAKMLTNSCQG